MRNLKKIFLIILFLVFLVGIVYYFLTKNTFDEKGSTERMKNTASEEVSIYKMNKNPAKEQTISNDSSKDIVATLNESGIYEVSTIKMKDTSQASTDTIIPPLDATFTGVFISKDQSLDIPANSVVKFSPVKFDLLGSTGDFTLNKMGSYYVGSQLAPGSYQVAYSSSKDPSLEDRTNVQVIITLDGEIKQSIELNQANQSSEILLKKGMLVSIKSNEFHFQLIFEKKEE